MKVGSPHAQQILYHYSKVTTTLTTFICVEACARRQAKHIFGQAKICTAKQGATRSCSRRSCSPCTSVQANCTGFNPVSLTTCSVQCSERPPPMITFKGDATVDRTWTLSMLWFETGPASKQICWQGFCTTVDMCTPLKRLLVH